MGDTIRGENETSFYLFYDPITLLHLKVTSFEYFEHHRGGFAVDVTTPERIKRNNTRIIPAPLYDVIVSYTGIFQIE